MGSRWTSVDWVNSGLMTFFFFVVGLEARREFDMGELRERRRVTLPLVAGLGRHGGAGAIYLAVNAGHGSAHGWGGDVDRHRVRARHADARRATLPGAAARVHADGGRVDDVVALVVIATVYTGGRRRAMAAAVAGSRSSSRCCSRCGRRPRRRSSTSRSAWPSGWRSLKSGVDPVVIGLAMGLLTYAYPAAAHRPRARDRALPPLPGAADARARPVAPGSASTPPSRRTSGCSSSTTRGRAT